MITAAQIINKTRMTLGDMNEPYRWPTERLLDLVDEGHKDICAASALFVAEAYVPLEQKRYIYDLPENALRVERIGLMDHVRLPFKTASDMDNIASDWREHIGCPPEYIIRQQSNYDKFEVYPIPDCIEYKLYANSPSEICINTMSNNDEYTNESCEFVIPVYDTEKLYNLGDTFFFVDKDLAEDSVASPWGIITGYGELSDDETTLNMKTVMGTEYGGVTTYMDPELGVVDQYWGLVSMASVPETTLKIDYLAIPFDINDVDAPLIISDIWATALKYYVTGYALQDDNDAGNIQRGQLMLQRYEIELRKAKKLRAEGGHVDRTARLTAYNPIGGLK